MRQVRDVGRKSTDRLNDDPTVRCVRVDGRGGRGKLKSLLNVRCVRCRKDLKGCLLIGGLAIADTEQAI